ncbi:type II toxin-antitoxin system VapB family antitoxin [Aminobacter sp. BE322]|uniref:type II toxin-antitoxin system VapB family antitoxin n=1 Tax=unclassified Aminobacter TaxID=2644704 RepID=UPI003D1CC3A3
MTIQIDDDLMMKAMNATGESTKKATVETALRTVVTIAGQKAALEELRGMGWEGDLGVMRNDWAPDADWALDGEK